MTRRIGFNDAAIIDDVSMKAIRDPHIRLTGNWKALAFVIRAVFPANKIGINLHCTARIVANRILITAALISDIKIVAANAVVEDTMHVMCRV